MIQQFICTKWGVKYGAEDVNTLYRSVKRFSEGEIRFSCVTDDGSGLDTGIEVLPLPALPQLGQETVERGWLKLALFSPEIQSTLSGPTLFLDLDLVVIRSLAPFFETAAGFCVIRDYKRLRYRNRWTGNTSVFLYHPERDYGVYRELVAQGDAVKQRYRNEQEFLSDVMRGIGELKYWPKHWCASYKYHCIPAFPMSLWREPQAPTDAKILVFHGNPKPADALKGIGGKWYRPMRPAPWLAPYLQQDGG